MKLFRSKILGTGRYLPDKIVTNQDLSKILETSHEWIVERTGICERRISDPLKDEIPSGMAAIAAKQAIEKSNLTVNDIDFILFSVTMPDMMLPNTASILQHRLGITNNCPCLDVNAACSGWVYAMTMANSFIQTGLYKNILVVGCEMTSAFNNWDDRSTAILFGDGCGAVVLGRASENEETQIYATILGSDGSKKDSLILATGGSATPLTIEILEKKKHAVAMNGPEVFKAAVKTIASQSQEILSKAELKLEQVNWFIPHQANLRIIEAAAQRLNFPTDKIITNVDRYANTSSASIPIALDEAIQDNKVKRGDILLLAAFGAGLTSGAMVLKY